MKNLSFNKLSLCDSMILNLKSLGYDNMTPIQEESLPFTLRGDDLIAQAKTGSGKTASFGIVLLNKLKVEKFRIQSLVLCPTRELAEQVANELRNIAKFRHNIKITTICGGVPYSPQVNSLYHKAHIIVGTAGRVLKHLKENNFSTEDIETLVLDEADRMLDMGFSEDINAIIDFLPKKRQTLLFSATYPENIETLSSEITINPKIIKIDSTHNETTIKQSFFNLNGLDNKVKFIINKLNIKKPTSTVIFCNTKIACNDLADSLLRYGLDVLVLNSDLEQRDRVECLVMFANKSYPILIATDVASRGLDVDNIDLVINYELPYDSEVYTHRVGRTARAGNSGESVSLVDDSYIRVFDELKEYLSKDFLLEDNLSLDNSSTIKLDSIFDTIYINGGKKAKIRAGDILGVLTAKIGLDKDDVGKIDNLPHCSYVAIKKSSSSKALIGLNENRIKGKFFKAYKK